MKTFEEIVRDNFEKSLRTGKKVKTVYGRTSSGQQYACLVTSGLWYAVRLIMEEENRHLPRSGIFAYSNYSCVELPPTQHLTLAGADEKIAEYQEILSDIETNCSKFYSKYLKGSLWRICVPLPKDWANKLDTYLERGDIIQCDFYAAHHVGIYLGNGKVAHMSGHGGGKADGKARIGDMIPNFVEKASSTVEVIVLWVRARPKEKIASTAERYAAQGFREGEYNLLFRNCQHFVTLCALGDERGLEIFYI